MFGNEKAWKESQKKGLTMALVSVVYLIVLAIASLNPVSIIGDATKSFYSMLASFKPYATEGVNYGSVNGLLVVAMIMLVASLLIILVNGILAVTGEDENKFNLINFAAWAIQFISLILVIVAKTVARSNPSISGVKYTVGFYVLVVVVAYYAYEAIRNYTTQIAAIADTIYGFFLELHTTWYSIIALAGAGLILIISLFYKVIKFSAYQEIGNLFSTVFGGFNKYIIGLFTNANNYNFFFYSMNGKIYHLIDFMPFKLAYYGSVALLISVVVAVAGIGLAFIKKNLGSIMAFLGGAGTLGSAIVINCGARLSTVEAVGCIAFEREYNVVSGHVFALMSIKPNMGPKLILVAAIILFVATTLKALSSFSIVIKTANEKLNSVSLKLCDVLSAVFAAGLIVIGFIPGLNIINISDKMDKKSLISSLGDYDKYVELFKDGIERQYYQASMFKVLIASGVVLLAAAVLVIAGIAVKNFVNKKIGGIVEIAGACGLILSLVLNFTAYNKISIYDITMNSVVGSTINDYRGYLSAHVGLGMLVACILAFAVLFTAGISFKGTASIAFARIAAVLTAVFAFVPGLNPGRICTEINKNKGLWSVMGGFDSFIENINSQSFVKAFCDERAMLLLYWLCMIVFVAVIALVVGFCLSFGEIKLKKASATVMTIGSAIGLGAMICFPALVSFNEENLVLAKYTPLQPQGIWIYIIAFMVCLAFSFAGMLKLPVALETDKVEIKSNYKLFLMALPFIALVLVFSYLPLWGWRYSFYDYTPGADLSFRDFVGWDWFKFLVQRKSQRVEIVRVLRNTLVMSGLGLSTQFLPVVFAIFISEIKRPWFKKLIQTITTIPNFISWVLVYAIARALFESDGFVNNLFISLNLYSEPKLYLQFSGFATCVWMLLFGIWKGLGWSAIVYIAAISGIDQQLYEAAAIDGAGRFKRMWHITVPGLMPTFMVMFLLAIAGVLSNGMDQYYVFKTSSNKEWIEVLDYYVYRLGLGDGSVALATIIGMLKSIVSVVLLFIANGVSKLIRGESIV